MAETLLHGWRPEGWRWAMGARVRKIKGSSWQGYVVGFYRTSLTPEGYCVESEREPGSVQLYPAAALQLKQEPPPDVGAEEFLTPYERHRRENL